jgi:hypothetical protein
MTLNMCLFRISPITRSFQRMRTRVSSSLALLILTIIFSCLTCAQNQPKPAATDNTGWTSYVQFVGTSNADGQVFQAQTSAGYSFTERFGMDFGLPVYFVHASSSNAGGVSGHGVGNPWVDLRYKVLTPRLNYGIMLTGSAPLGDSKLGLSTGRATFDWNNRVERTFAPLTPFLEAGLANSIADSRLFLRPYTTLGMNAHFQAGTNINVWKRVSVGASLYDIAPFGNQTVFSRVTGASGAPNNPGASHGRNFQATQQTTGTSAIARDNGFSTWLDAGLSRYLDAEIGFTRSVHYDLNSVSFAFGFNLGRLLHESN